MKRTVKLFVSLILCLSVILSFASCHLFNSRRDRRMEGSYLEALYEKWIETYDEILTIVERLRSNGYQESPIPAFNPEEYGIDVKFKIRFYRNYLADLDEGKEIYEIPILAIECWVFLEDVAAEELESLGGEGQMFYDCFLVSSRNVEPENPENAEDIQFEEHLEKRYGTTSYRVNYSIRYNGKYQIRLCENYTELKLTEEQIEILKKAIVII